MSRVRSPRGYTQLYNFLVPLYALSLGMSAGQIGMLVGGRSLLAVFLSIHVGVPMDRFGTRRVTLLFVWMAIGLAPVFPLLQWFWPLVLQIVNGGALQLRRCLGRGSVVRTVAGARGAGSCGRGSRSASARAVSPSSTPSRDSRTMCDPLR